MDTIECFADILASRRREISNYLWVSRRLDTVLAYRQHVKRKPSEHKKEVLAGPRIQELIENICANTGRSKKELETEVRLILDEIGFKRQLNIIRWLALVLTKISKRIYSGIYIHQPSLQHLKSVMGTCPVIFAPSHRSYADFILTSYMCFCLDIEIPTTAAGMDFHAMKGMGSVLRDTGAFFMRRSFNNDLLYWTTFEQYVQQLVKHSNAPIEFFVEGTRSRSCKSLMPKIGLLSMALQPLFFGEVPDVLIVPISISYDRILEERLFAFEHLGIPKPKESTSALFKSLSIIKENYGSIYVHFTTPISVKQYFGTSLNRVAHALRPIHQQQLDSSERKLITDLSYDVVQTQQKHSVLTTFNLAAILLTNNDILLKLNPYTQAQFSEEIHWLESILERCGAIVFVDDLSTLFSVHKNLVRVDQFGVVHLVYVDVSLNHVQMSQLKTSHKLSNEVMVGVIPAIMLQLYVNPCLHYLVDCCLLVAITASLDKPTKAELFERFQFLRTLFSWEFVFNPKREAAEFESALDTLDSLNVMQRISDGMYTFGPNEKLRTLLLNLLNPFIASYSCICVILMNEDSAFIEHSYILAESQRLLEIAIVDKSVVINPYCLSLDTLTLCIQSLNKAEVLQKCKNKTSKYEIIWEKLNVTAKQLEPITSACIQEFMKYLSENDVPQFSAKL